MVLRHALLLGRHDVTREHGEHRTVHRHGHAHLVQRNAVEQNLHVLDGIDGHAGLTHIAGNAGMVGVVSTMGGEVEGDADTLLACRQILSVESVRRLGRGKACVLTNRPRPTGVHRRPHTTRVGGKAGQRIERLQVLQIGGGVERLDIDAFGRMPGQCLGGVDLGLFRGKGIPGVEGGGLKVVQHVFNLWEGGRGDPPECPTTAPG